jgi:DNA polymerase-3 subunit gamma/tau
MLTTEAFNALLKTLEEPPAHVLFLLCTTAPEKLPETILSRLVRFNFRKARPVEVEASLKKAADGEKLKVEKGVLELIAKRVDGSFRDGQKILDQLTGKGKGVTLGEAKALLGQIESLSPLKLIGFLSRGETKEALLEIGRLMEEGVDLKTYLQDFLGILRQVLMARLKVIELPEPAEAKELGVDEIKRMLAVFSRVAQEQKRSQK